MIAAGLRALIAARVDDVTDIEITNLTRTSSGYSRENWPFDVSWHAPGSNSRVRHELILRRDPLGSVLVTDRRVEFAVLRALEGSPVPAPRAMWLDADGEYLGRPSVVMETLPRALRLVRALGRRVATLGRAPVGPREAILRVDGHDPFVRLARRAPGRCLCRSRHRWSRRGHRRVGDVSSRSAARGAARARGGAVVATRAQADRTEDRIGAWRLQTGQRAHRR